MSLHRVALSEVQAQPWRNGGGSTREMLAWPQADGWQLRVSVATIAQDGPFSAFPGVGRWFTVLSGAGVLLAFAGGVQRLTPDNDPLHFDGAAAPACSLLAGPTDDLNLMAVSSAGRAAMWRTVPARALQPGSRWRGVFSTEPLVLRCGEQTVELPADTLLWSDDTPDDAWHPLHAARAWCMELRA